MAFKCNNCISCTKDTLYNNHIYLYCWLCKRVWKLQGHLPVEIFDEVKQAVLKQIDLKVSE